MPTAIAIRDLAPPELEAGARVLGRGMRDNPLIGVCAMTPPGRGRPTMFEKARMFPGVVMSNPPRTVRAILNWTGAWTKDDPDEPHWHLGPVAVDRDLQRQGVGGLLLREFRRAVDADTTPLAYLETDKQENVTFYARHGFVVTGGEQILGVRNWYMERRPRAATSATPER